MVDTEVTRIVGRGGWAELGVPRALIGEKGDVDDVEEEEDEDEEEEDEDVEEEDEGDVGVIAIVCRDELLVLTCLTSSEKEVARVRGGKDT